MNQLESSDDDTLQESTSPVKPHIMYYNKSEIRDSPSFRDGLSTETEIRYRREAARFILNVGTKIGMPYTSVSTGVVLFHRFYMFHSFKKFPRYITACCCLFLAGKVEETPKKCKDVIKIVRMFVTDNQFAQFGNDPKEEILTLEKILMKTIKFDFNIDHPYPYMMKYVKIIKVDKLKLSKIVQMAWTFINDSLCTTLCLEWEPEVVAIAVIYLAGKLSMSPVTDWKGRTCKQKYWWDMYIDSLTIEILEDICHQILDLYASPVSQEPHDSPPPSPPSKSLQKDEQVSSNLKTPPPINIPEEMHVPENRNESLGVATVLSSNSSNETVSGVLTSCSSSSSAPGPVTNSESSTFSTHSPGRHHSDQVDALTSSDSAEFSSSPENFAIEDIGTSETGYLDETLAYLHLPVSCSKAYASQNDPNAFEAVSAQPIVSAPQDMSATQPAYFPSSVSFGSPYFATYQQPSISVPTQLRMEHVVVPPPSSPAVIISSSMLSRPPPIQFPHVLATQPNIPPPLPQHQPSSLLPPQSTPIVSIPQFPPPPPLHGPGSVANRAPHPPSSVTRLPPPLVRAPVLAAISPPPVPQLTRHSHSPNPRSPPQNVSRPNKTLNTSDTSLQSGFLSSPQKSHGPARQSTTRPVLLEKSNPETPTTARSHPGTFYADHSQSYSVHLLQNQNAPPPSLSVIDSSGHYNFRGNSNSVPHWHSVRPSIGPESRHPPPHSEDRGGPRYAYEFSRAGSKNNYELDRVRPRNHFDSSAHPHYPHDVNSRAAYSGMSHQRRRYSRYNRNYGHRRRTPTQYSGHSYGSDMPQHLRLTPYQPAPREYNFGSQSGSHHWPPVYTTNTVSNEMPRGFPRTRSGIPGHLS